MRHAEYYPNPMSFFLSLSLWFIDGNSVKNRQCQAYCASSWKEKKKASLKDRHAAQNEKVKNLVGRPHPLPRLGSVPTPSISLQIWHKKQVAVDSQGKSFNFPSFPLPKRVSTLRVVSFDPWKGIKSLQPYLLSSLYRMRSQQLSLRCGCGSLVSNLVFLSLSTAQRKR